MVSLRFGEVWTIGDAVPESLPPVPHLIVSSDLYNASGLGLLAAEIDAHDLRSADIHEQIPGIGTAMLDRIAWYPVRWLGEHIGDLPTARHAQVSTVIRNLIGNEPL